MVQRAPSPESDPDAYVEPATAGIALGEFNFLDWELPDPVVLAKTGLGTSGDNVSNPELQRPQLQGNDFRRCGSLASSVSHTPKPTPDQNIAS